MKPVAILIMSAALAGCAATTSADDVSYLFRAQDQACVHKEILDQLAEHEWTVTSSTPQQIVARKRAPPWLNTAVLTAYFEPPMVTMAMALAPSGNDVKVVLHAGAIIDPRPGREKVEPMAPTAQMDAALRGAARRIDRACRI